MAPKTLLSLLAGAATVAAHGHVENIVINGVYYAGYDVTTYPYESDPPVVVGWATDATDNGYVAPDAYSSSDIICHKNAENAKGHAQVAAGDNIYIQWTAWPESHKGPVIDYLAACSDSGCEAVDKTSLEFFKISEKGLVDGSGSPGTYASDQLIDNNNGWLVQIPSTIKPGFYVLRHEIIALHSAENSDGAQNYPQCFNLEVTGSGSEVPDGTLGTALYKTDDAGILVNIYTSTSTYDIPGPTLISGATEVSQSSSAVASTGTATSGTALATGSSSESTAAAAASSVAATSSAAATSAAAAATSVAAVSETAAPQAVATSSSAAAPAQTGSASSGSGASRCGTKRKAKRGSKARRSFTPVHA